MFSKEESRHLRQSFWIAFGKSFPKKWILYKTKLKELDFKFHFDTKKARVAIEIDSTDVLIRKYYFEKLEGLKSQFEEAIVGVQFHQSYWLENNKEIATVFIALENVSIHNKNDWATVMQFFVQNMEKFESIWADFEDYIKS